VAPALRDAPALRLADGPVRFGAIRAAAPDERDMDLDITLAVDGSAEVAVRERMRGWPAVEWREALDQVAPDRLRPAFEQRTLAEYFPGATLKELKWSGENDDGGPFVVEYRFRSLQLARRVGKKLVFPAPFPANLGRRYANVAARKTPLSLEYVPPTELRAHVKVPAGVTVELPPAARADGFGVFEQRTRSTANGFNLEALFFMPQARVPPERYREFVEFALRVDRSEARAAELQVAK
jgi:hypothetical protein